MWQRYTSEVCLDPEMKLLYLTINIQESFNYKRIWFENENTELEKDRHAQSL